MDSSVPWKGQTMSHDADTELVLQSAFAKWWDETGLELKPFEPHVGLLSGHDTLNLLICIFEDVSYVNVRVNFDIDLLRHSYEKRYVGIQFWLGYNPHLLLPDLR